MVHRGEEERWNMFTGCWLLTMNRTFCAPIISLRIRKTGGGTELTVSDTGEGIAPEHLPHIFERFYKMSPERGEKDGSSGLGLYIVKTVVEAMDGTVRADSTPGKGTVFTIRF